MISDNIKYLRDKSKLRQTDLAKLLGITRAGVNSWEMGLTTPSTKYVIKLSELFNVSTDFILDVRSEVADIPTELLLDELRIRLEKAEKTIVRI